MNTDMCEVQGIGVIIQDGISYPCCVVVDKIVVFPSPPTIKSKTPKKVKFRSPCDIQFLTLSVMNVPYSTLYDGYHVVIPNRLRREPPVPDHLFQHHFVRSHTTPQHPDP